MQWIGEWWRRLLFWSQRNRFEQDLADEMRLHVELLAEERQGSGASPEQAAVEARRRFGYQTILREHSRESWGWGWLDAMQQDFRYAVRTLLASPAFTATALLSLVLGMGANTAIFSIINAVMLRSLPVQDPHQLVEVVTPGSSIGSFTNPIWEELRDRQNIFSRMLAYSTQGFDLSNGGEIHKVEGAWVSGDFFGTLGVPAIRGRVLSAEDDVHGGGRSGPVAVISYKFWQRKYNADPDIIGKSISLDRHPFVIIGVTPPWFTGLDVDRSFDVAIPIGCEPIFNPDSSDLNNRSSWWLQIVGRLPAGVTLQQANEHLKALAPEVFRATLPPHRKIEDQNEYLAISLAARPAATGFSTVGTEYKTALLTLMAIVGLVLLIACANIANLLLARGVARQREFSIRLAIGATRGRVIRQLMVESVVLSFLGSVGGLLAALWGSKLLLRLLSTSQSALEINLSPDVHVLTFTLLAALVTALLFGLAPAWRTTRLQPNQVLKESAATTIRGSSRFSFGKILVAGQVALTLILLIGASLFLKTFANLMTVDTGFNSERLLVVLADTQQAAIPKAQRSQVFDNIVQRLRALPGVTSAASAGVLPISHRIWNDITYPEGYVAKSRMDTLVYFNTVSPEYFATMQTPIVRGRGFDEHDNANSPKAIIMGERAAARFFAGQDPIGKLIGIEVPDKPNEMQMFHVIGVAKEVKYAELSEDPKLTGYLAIAQDPGMSPRIFFVLRTEGPPDLMASAVRDAIAAENRNISIMFRDYELQLRESLVEKRLLALLSAFFGGLALMLATIGLYGVTAYSVRQRQGEIGIRIALGARPRSVVWLVLRDVVVILIIGTLTGLAGALAAGKLVSSLLYGIKANDPAQLTIAALALALATALAASIPAKRAAKLDPMVALREG